jgi:hypothetical protein
MRGSRLPGAKGINGGIKLSTTARFARQENPRGIRGFSWRRLPEPGWGPGGRRFKSCLPDRRIQTRTMAETAARARIYHRRRAKNDERICGDFLPRALPQGSRWGAKRSPDGEQRRTVIGVCRNASPEMASAPHGGGRRARRSWCTAPGRRFSMPDGGSGGASSLESASLQRCVVPAGPIGLKKRPPSSGLDAPETVHTGVTLAQTRRGRQ